MTDRRSDRGGTGERPVLRIVRGDPDDAELAALTAVLSAAAAASTATEPEPQARSRWSDRQSMLRRPPRHGPGAWRASALPY